MRKLLTSAAMALALAVSPAAGGAELSRASAPAVGASNFTGEDGSGLILALVIAVATIFTLIEVTDDDDPDSP